MPTGIEYVDETWNIMSGCTPITVGCTHCYAERMARRLAGRFGYPEAPHHFDVTLRPDRLDEPLRRKKPTRYLVCSMGDLFHKDVPGAFLFKAIGMMQTCNNHTFLVLTKRPKRMAAIIDQWFDAYRSEGLSVEQVLPNVWLGVTAENEATANIRIPVLLSIPAAKHWVSLEPMLGPIDVKPYLYEQAGFECEAVTDDKAADFDMVFQAKGEEPIQMPVRMTNPYTIPALDWVVLGGETGPGARPMHPDWVRKVRDDCVAAGIDYFFKGWGAFTPESDGGWKNQYVVSALRDGGHWHVDDIGKHGIQPCALMWKVGKKAAGRLLDGREWNEMPGD